MQDADDDIFYTATPFSSVNRLLDKLYAITVEACRNLPSGKDRSTIVTDVCGSIDVLLCDVDRNGDDRALTSDANTLYEQEIERIQRFYVRAAERAAVLTYLRGMAIGIPALVALATLVGVGLRVFDEGDLQTEAVVTALVGGGLGAVISVMTRIGSRRFEIDFEADRRQVIVLGAVRPLIGAILGVALYVFIESDLLPLRVPDRNSDQHFYAAIGFLAGFSERWAQDMLGVAQRGTEGTGVSG